MINQLLSTLVNLMYRTKQVRQRFEHSNPNERVWCADASKGIITRGDQNIKRGVNWITSQRAVVMLTDKQIICGKWAIPIDAISKAQLIKINSWLGSGQVLKIETFDNKHYQFGMQLNPEWTTQQILPLTLEKGQLEYSVFSLAIRIWLIGYIIYSLYEHFIAN